jgi:hypothetical protein
MTNYIRRTITPAEVARQQAGAQERIATGFWRDANGHVHVSIPELLDMVGLEHTPENIAECERAIAAAFGGTTTTIVRQVVAPIS